MQLVGSYFCCFLGWCRSVRKRSPRKKRLRQERTCRRDCSGEWRCQCHAGYIRPSTRLLGKGSQGGYRGTCVLQLVVDTKGMPQDIKVTRAIGMGLDEEAIEAVRKWRFKPAMKDGLPVRALINVEVSLRRNDGFDDKFVKADAGDAKAQFEISQAFLSGQICPRMNRGIRLPRESRQARLAQGSVRNGRVCVVPRK